MFNTPLTAQPIRVCSRPILWDNLNLDKLLTLFYSKHISKYDTTLVDYLSLVVFIHAAAALNLIGLLLKPYLYWVINRKDRFR